MKGKESLRVTLGTFGSPPSAITTILLTWRWQTLNITKWNRAVKILEACFQNMSITKILSISGLASDMLKDSE